MQFHLADLWISTELSRNQTHPLRQDRSKQCLRDGKSSMLTKHLKFKVQSLLFFFLQWTLDLYLNGFKKSLVWKSFNENT